MSCAQSWLIIVQIYAQSTARAVMCEVIHTYTRLYRLWRG